MHRDIRYNLEDFLIGEEVLQGEEFLDRSGSRIPAEFRAHLGECAECAGELRSLQAQSQLLRSLRPPQDIEPRPGFYARVIRRIEAQPASMWSAFLDRKFGFRLAVASAALVALLGTYLVTSEPGGPESASSPVVVLTDTPRTAEASLQTQERIEQPEDGPRQQQHRDAVLLDLASYHQ
jgi:hypothetical protein